MFNIGQLIDILNGKLISGDINKSVSSVGIDSRNIKNGQLYIPIVGKNFDGHDFIEDALNKGAIATLTSKKMEVRNDGKIVIEVENTLDAITKLAKYHISKFNIPVIAVTGSVGKTSTKDMIAGVLSQKYNVLKTEGNFNNEIGLPLTIFRIDENHDASVLEMGMSNFGEISHLSMIAKPKFAVITNVGYSHIENLGSKEGILKAKMEIIDGLEDGILILNGDDELLYKESLNYKEKIILFGNKHYNDIRFDNFTNKGEIGSEFDLLYKDIRKRITLNSPGIHSVYNALAAISIGFELNLTIEEIEKGLNNFSSSKMRMDIIKKDYYKIINDCYNASPTSMKAAIDVLDGFEASGNKIAILGDMLELGEHSEELHKDIGKYISEKNINILICVGNLSKYILNEFKIEKNINNCYYFKTNNEVIDFLKNFKFNDDIILIKGSRSMKLEEILEFIKHT